MIERKEAVAIVLLSLRAHPEEWEFTDYRAMNEKIPAEIWLGNRYYATELKFSGHVFGGSSLLFYRRKWRKELCDAADAARWRRCCTCKEEPRNAKRVQRKN